MLKIRKVNHGRGYNKNSLENALNFIENLPLDYVPKTYSLDVHFNEKEVHIYPLEILNCFSGIENIKDCSITHERDSLRIKQQKDNTINYIFHFNPYKEKN